MNRTPSVCWKCKKLIGMAKICPYCHAKQYSNANKTLAWINRNYNYLKLIFMQRNSYQKLIIITCAMFCLELLFTLLFAPTQIFNSILSVPPNEIIITLGAATSTGLFNGQWWGMFTANFLHGGLIHLGFNMMVLKFLGPIIENLSSRWFFLLIYLLSGSLSILTSLSLTNYNVVSIGASGAIYGMMGCGIVLSYYYGHGKNDMIMKMLIQMALFGLLFGLLPGIDNTAHLAGFIIGGACGFAHVKWIKNKFNKLIKFSALALSAITILAFIHSLFNFLPTLIMIKFFS